MSTCGTLMIGDVIRTDCDLSRPVPPGKPFGTLVPVEEVRRKTGMDKIQWPPFSEQDACCSLDSETQEMTSSVWGKVALCDDGIIIEPLWRVADDKMLLTVEVDYEDCFGEEITAQALLDAAPKAVASLSIDASVLEDSIAQSRREGTHLFVALARGLYPEPGKDGVLKILQQKDKKAGTLREDGSMDFRERGGLHFVKKGATLGELIPAVPGTTGYDIFGIPVEPPEPREAMVKVGSGIASKTSRDGRTVFSAELDGVFRYRNGGIEVSELFEVNGDVDLETGNIRAASGAVHVRGNVRSGFTVEAEGDVVVDGLIEDADVTAGGLVVAGGIIMSGKNTITAREDVQAKFFQNVIIRAGGRVVAGKEISHCDIRAGGDVVAEGAKGIISGGHIRSLGNIKAKALGNPARARTVLELLVKTVEEDELMEKRLALTDELERLDESLGSDDAMSMLMTAPEEDRRILAELVKVRGRIQGELRSLDGVIVDKRRAAREELKSRHVWGVSNVFSGVEVVIGKRKTKIREDMEAAKFHLDSDATKVVAD